jgi:osmoprotectant transport system ATP-binding protein
MSVAVEFDHVSFAHAGSPAVLRNLVLSVPSGQSLALIGRSGSGKTTVLKLINRLLEPSSGEVRVEGVPTHAWDPIRLRRRIGYVLQEIGLFPHLTVAGNVAVVPDLEGWPRDRIDGRVRELLNMLGLPPDRFASRFPRELSGGQRQRVGIARALAADPPVLLMDEPFGALDQITRDEMNQELLKIWEQTKTTVIFVTHSIAEAIYLSDRVVVLSSRPGTIVDIVDVPLGRPRDAEVKRRPEFLETELRVLRALEGRPVHG